MSIKDGRSVAVDLIDRWRRGETSLRIKVTEVELLADEQIELHPFGHQLDRERVCDAIFAGEFKICGVQVRLQEACAPLLHWFPRPE